MREVLVVGGSIAALTAVDTLRMHDFDGSITVISDENAQPYTRVPLSKGVLAGRETADDIALPALSDDVDVRLGTPAIGLDVDAQRVITTAGPVRYDKLIIATGARARRIGGANQDERVLRNLGDAHRMRAEMAASSTVLVVGGGFLGMEVASTASELGKQVTVIDVVPPLDRLLGADVSGHVRRAAHQRGVRIVVAPGGVNLEGEPAPTAVMTTDGRRFEADLVVSAVGDIPNTEWLATSGLLAGGGLVVDDRCRVAHNVFAAGDVAATRRADGSASRIPSWTNAVEQGRAAAEQLLFGCDAGRYRPSHYFWTEQFGLDVKVVGEGRPDGTPTCLDGGLDHGSALLAWPSADAPSHIAAINHKATPARLKRMRTTGATVR